MVGKAYASTVTVFRNGQPYIVRGVKLSYTKGTSISTDGSSASNSLTIIFNPKYSFCSLGVPFKEEDFVMVGEASSVGEMRLVVSSITEHFKMGVSHHLEVFCA